MEYDRFLIKEEGYTFVNDLLEADAEELHDLVDDAEREAGMKIPEGRRLLKAIERERARAVDPSAELRAELSGMGMRDLRRHAFRRMQEEGAMPPIDAESMSEAEQSDRPVEALTELLVRAELQLGRRVGTPQTSARKPRRQVEGRRRELEPEPERAPRRSRGAARLAKTAVSRWTTAPCCTS